MHPEGTPTEESGVMESPHVVRVIVSAKEHSFVTWLLLYTMFVTTVLLQQLHLTLISGLWCSRCRTAALQPHPPERNAFHTWARNKDRGNESISGGILFVNNLGTRIIVCFLTLFLAFYCIRSHIQVFFSPYIFLFILFLITNYLLNVT